jgi:DNA-binding response OmpR family regulator
METRDKTVLLVEDEDNIAHALEYLIRRQGFGLTRVSSGADALAALEAEPADLVVLDVMLPGRSGYEILQEIRESDALRDIKVLLMTASGGETDRRKGLAIGADAFFTKPFVTSELTDEICRLLDEDAHG